MPKRFKIDFFTSHPPEGFKVQDLIKTVSQMPDDDSRNQVLSDYPVRMKVALKHKHYFLGDLYKIRLHEPVAVASKSGKVKPITTNSDEEGLGERSAFLYDTTNGIWAHQRNRTGVSAQNASLYFSFLLGLDDLFELRPIPNLAVKEIAKSKTKARSIRIRLATPSDLQAVLGKDSNVLEFAQAAKKIEAPYVDVTFSMGHFKGGMDVKRVMSCITEALTLNEGREKDPVVTALEYGARDDEDAKTVLLDLLSETIFAESAVESSPLVEEFMKRRHTCLIEAYEENIPRLRPFFQKC